MRTEILRSPETDRKRVEIPNLLTDMNDYASRMAAGRVSATGLPDPMCPLFQQPFATQTYGSPAAELVLPDFDTSSVGVTQGPNGLIVPAAGLYLITAVVGWNSYSANCGMSSISPPGPGLAIAYILAGSSASTPLVDGISLTAILPMEAGDEARISVLNNDSVNTVGPILYASLALARIA